MQVVGRGCVLLLRMPRMCVARRRLPCAAAAAGGCGPEWTLAAEYVDKMKVTMFALGDLRFGGKGRPEGRMLSLLRRNHSPDPSLPRQRSAARASLRARTACTLYTRRIWTRSIEACERGQHEDVNKVSVVFMRAHPVRCDCLLTRRRAMGAAPYCILRVVLRNGCII